MGALQLVPQDIALLRGSRLGGLAGKLLLVESAAVLQLRGHQPPAHMLHLLVQALLEVIAQDLCIAVLQGLQGRVLDVLRGHAACPLQAGPCQLCLPLLKHLYFPLHALPANVSVDPFPESPVEVGIDFPVQPVPVLYLLHNGVREGGLGAAVPDVEWEGDDAVQVPAQYFLQQHHGLVKVLGDEEQVKGRLNGLQHELHPLSGGLSIGVEAKVKCHEVLGIVAVTLCRVVVVVGLAEEFLQAASAGESRCALVVHEGGLHELHRVPQDGEVDS